MCFFGTSAFFSLPAAGLFSCSRLRGTHGGRPDTRAQVWALAEVRGTCSGGSKWQVPSGRDSEHVEPSRPMQTYVRNTCDTFYTWVKKMSDDSCDIYDIECRQCRHTLLRNGKVFPRYLTCETCDHFQYKIQSPSPRKDSRFSLTILRGKCDHSMVRPSPATHSCTSTIMFKVNYTAVLSRIAVRV